MSQNVYIVLPRNLPPEKIIQSPTGKYKNRVAITHPISVSTTGVYADTKEEALQNFGIAETEHKKYLEFHTNKKNTILLVRLPIISPRQSLPRWEPIVPVLEEFAEKLGKPISIENMYGDTIKVSPQDPWLYIFIHSRPGRSSRHSVTHLFDISLFDSQTTGFQTTNLGKPITDNDGTVVAEVVNETTIYIHYCIADPINNITAEVLWNVLNEYYLLYVLPPEEAARIREEQEAERIETSARRFAEECVKRQDAHIHRLQEELERVSEELEKLGVKFVKLAREKTAKTSLVEAAQNAPRRGIEDYLGAFSELQDNTAMFETVYIRGSKIYAHTHALERNGNHFGKFMIVIDMDNSTIKAFPKGYERQAGGVWCLGDAEYGMTELLALYEYPTAINFMIAYLKQNAKAISSENAESIQEVPVEPPNIDPEDEDNDSEDIPSFQLAGHPEIPNEEDEDDDE